jgi:thioredoxin reductase (NADPH)
VPADEIAETPDLYGAYPRLSQTQIGNLEVVGERRKTQAGDVLFREGEVGYDFFVVLDGLVETVGSGKRLAVHGPGRFLGELSLLERQPAFYSAVVVEPGEVLAVPAEKVRRVVMDDPALGDLILRAFILRRTLLIELGVGVQVVGSRHSPDSRRLRDFLARNRIPHSWLDVEEDAEAEEVLRALGVGPGETPVVICRGSEVLRNPTVAELAAELGLRAADHRQDAADLLVVGAGPAGLAASVYGASEGLGTVIVDAVATGGQAGTSPRIENYLGFPAGISGAELAERAVIQAGKFGAHIVVPADAAGLDGAEAYVVDFGDGEQIVAHTIVLATGARYRKLDVPRLEEFEGVSVHYAATVIEALLCRMRPVAVVGGGNSAGQAALFLTRHSPKVHLLIRDGDIDKDMSRYLVDRIRRNPQIEVRVDTEVRELVGEGGELRAIVVEDNRSGERETLEVVLLFVFIGAVPCTAWLTGALALDEDGFVRTGGDVERLNGAWPDEGRRPFPLETSRPGIFAAGDVRSGSVKRVASAVGEGSMAVQFVHRYLALRS